jgi:hypothetical protein
MIKNDRTESPAERGRGRDSWWLCTHERHSCVYKRYIQLAIHGPPSRPKISSCVIVVCGENVLIPLAAFLANRIFELKVELKLVWPSLSLGVEPECQAGPAVVPARLQERQI